MGGVPGVVLIDGTSVILLGRSSTASDTLTEDVLAESSAPLPNILLFWRLFWRSSMMLLVLDTGVDKPGLFGGLSAFRRLPFMSTSLILAPGETPRLRLPPTELCEPLRVSKVAAC